MSKIKVAVIGTGYLGSLHARIYKNIQTCSLEAVCDTDHARVEALSNELGVKSYPDFKKLLGEVDAVSIAVPTKLHFQIARDCILNGLHVLVEKPFTQTLAQADSLIKLAGNKNLILQVGHVERFNSAFSAAQNLFKDPYFIECHRLSLFPNRSLDVGVVLDLMIHDIDIVLGLVKSEIKRIDAVGVNVLTPFEDIANARLTFKNGCVCNLTASRVSDEAMRKIRIFLKNAYISLDYKNEQACVYRRSASGITKENLPIEKEQPLKKELSSFIDCIKEHRQPLVTGETARQALAVALKIRDKLWKNIKRY
ncbi:MAG: Gfo/Idh/MocA family oxidoreductase [Candidatus Omnitrophica bacterium]|nr:Gfo/Idh/MocA family oxidoreductase [Candidatus Omnitrophota bacterium]